jgi:hypothetical protein
LHCCHFVPPQMHFLNNVLSLEFSRPAKFKKNSILDFTRFFHLFQFQFDFIFYTKEKEASLMLTSLPLG